MKGQLFVSEFAVLLQDGATQHLFGKVLERFALQALSLPARQATQIVDRVAEAVIDAAKLIPPYIGEHPDFEEIGNRMVRNWQEGVDAFTPSEARE